MEIYLVGGAVRDELLNLPVKEKDWVVIGGTPDEMLAQGYLPVGKSFPVFIHPTTKDEYALGRLERKVGSGYHGFSFDTSSDVTLEEDLQRRDLTINAMAKNCETGDIIDPYGGKKDLAQKLLRHVAPAFSEDPVRVLRVARFAARFVPMGFKVAPETMTLMKSMVQNGECNFLVPERVWKEMSRALEEKSPIVFFEVLRECGALKVIMPEIEDIYSNSNSNSDSVSPDVYLKSASNTSIDPKIRFAAFVSHGDQAILQMCDRLNVPNDFRDLAKCVIENQEQCLQTDTSSSAQNILLLLEKCDAFRKEERFNQF